MTKKSQEIAVVPPELIERRIYLIRGEKVMLDRDLAEIYGVETRVLIQAVSRNLERFPDDFMFQLSFEELENWRSQIVISNPAAKMGLRRRPHAFTELGVAMLSSVLRAPGGAHEHSHHARVRQAPRDPRYPQRSGPRH